MSERRILRQRNSGEYFAIEIDGEGAQARIVAACGPLHDSEIGDILEQGFDADGELTDDFVAMFNACDERGESLLDVYYSHVHGVSI